MSFRAFLLLLGAILALLLAGLALVIRGVLRQSRADGIPDRVLCPKCGQPQPVLHQPAETKQGDPVCAYCGTELDRRA